MISPINLLLAAAPYATGSAPSIPWGRIVLALFFCLLLAFFAIAFIRARSGMAPMPAWLKGLQAPAASVGEEQDALEIVQRVGISPGSQLVVLQRGTQRYLLHFGDKHVTEIDRYAAPTGGDD